MKYIVKFSCGHEEQKELFGKMEERNKRIKYWEEYGLCYECYQKAMNEDCEEIEMPYKQYKNEYSRCKSKANSYNPQTKTVIVYVKKEG